ncbi:hypothetical protein [Catellatospora coxensis]|uniref:Uncharacterized protein n=1 Tax=Catellatospora coxensis TaxID=310354 RepID=A0A8J3KZ67_9ACTN|nr:hypothetical protein [Catellatospora coxensis]GIG11667.1 hypothetical protein Cco03nite_83670 [Catellatospora coxensis]
MNLNLKRLSVLVAAGAALLAATAGPAQAEEPIYPAALTHTRLVLDPAERGYTGTMQFTVTYRGTTANPNLSVVIAEPTAHSWDSISIDTPCMFNYGEDQRRSIGCGLESFEPGQTRTYTLTFHAYTPVQTEPMLATGGQLSIVDGIAGTVSRVRDFNATFRGANGKLKNPVPYVQDAQTDMTLTAGGSVTLVRQADGSFLGRLPMTLAWHGDAPNNEVWVGVDVPAGWYTPDTEPSANAPCWTGCSAPGGDWFDGEVRSFDMLIHAPEDTVVGSTGTISSTVQNGWGFTPITDVTPADNTVTFSYTVAD